MFNVHAFFHCTFLVHWIAVVLGGGIASALWIHDEEIDACFSANKSAESVVTVGCVDCLKASHEVHLITARVGGIFVDIVNVGLLALSKSCIVTRLHLFSTIIIRANHIVGRLAVDEIFL